MKKMFLLLVFTFFITSETSAITADPQRLMAIHITDIPPKNGVMIPGTGHSNMRDANNKDLLTTSQMLEINANLPWRRFTLHWTLGGPVESHDHSEGQMDWTNKNFAILEPLAELTSQSLGGHTQDWMSVGPHRISSKAVILAPIGKESEVPHCLQGQMQTYDKSATTIHQAVLNYLKSHNLPTIEYDFATSPIINVTPISIEAFITKVAALQENAPKSKHIDTAYKAINRMGINAYTENFKLGFTMTGRPVMTLLDDKALPLQILTIEGEKTTQADYLNPVLGANPKVKIDFSSSFAFEKIDLALKKLFLHANFFLAAEKLMTSNAEIATQLYKQAAQGDFENPAQIQAQINQIRDLLIQAKDQLPAGSAEVGQHWIMSLKIWLKYLGEHRIKMKEEKKPCYNQDPSVIRDHLASVAATAKLHGNNKILAFFDVK